MKRTIIRRRCNIPFETAKVPGWLESRKAIEDVLNTISFVLPAGEKFFIQSVQHYQDQIKDPVLREEMRLFAYQEAMHSKEHSRANAVVAKTFAQGPEIERLVVEALERVKRTWPRSSQLAFTCALEHFTAILSNNLLNWQKPFVGMGDPSFAAMWLWHAVEETEHKAVCFDVYQQVCGKGFLAYLHRVGMMLFATAILLWAYSASRRALRRKKLKSDGPSPVDTQASLPKSAKTKASWRTLASFVPMKLYLDYYRPSFHPWHTDDTLLIEEWKRLYRDYAPIVEAGTGLHPA